MQRWVPAPSLLDFQVFGHLKLDYLCLRTFTCQFA